MCTCNYMYTNHRKHYINNYMEVNFKEFQETVQVKELEESLEKIKTQMEEARRARRQVCLPDLAGSCACLDMTTFMALPIKILHMGMISVEVYI